MFILGLLAGVFGCVTIWAICEVRTVENWNR
jgi:hypothetical protein